MSGWVTKLRKRWVYLTKNVQFYPNYLSFNKKKWSKSVVSWFSYTIGISDVFANCIYLDKCKWLAKLCIFIICFGIWPNKDIDKRIYSGTGDKWHHIAVISLMSVIGHRTSLWLYDSLDSVMEAVTKSPYSRLVAYSLDYGSAEGPPRGVENRNLLSHPDDLSMEAYVIRMT